MSQTVGTVCHCSLQNTITLSNTFVDVFSYPITNGILLITMYETGVNIGGINIFISGGVAKNIAFSGQIGNADSDDLYYLPLNYGAVSNSNTYTVSFQYSLDNTIQVANTIGDPNVTINFTGLFSSGEDTYSNNQISADVIVETDTGYGTTFPTNVIMNGEVDIGTTTGDNNAINIGTASASGGRTITIGNTVSGSSVILNGLVETPNVSYGTITFNGSSTHSWTDINSVALRIGKVCFVTINATLTSVGLNILTAQSVLSFFSITPTINYTTSYVLYGIANDGNSLANGAMVSEASSATFDLIVPTTILGGLSTTIYATLTYVSI